MLWEAGASSVVEEGAVASLGTLEGAGGAIVGSEEQPASSGLVLASS